MGEKSDYHRKRAKKSKKENVEKYFDDVPKKKMKVSRLMKFMDKTRTTYKWVTTLKF